MTTLNLIELYVHEVTRRLPEKMRDDIAAELTLKIEDMLPENYTEADVKETLSKLGKPAILAMSYRDTPMYLIGPKVYPLYIQTLKMIMPWVIMITILVHIVEGIVSFTGEGTMLSMIINLFAMMIANIFNVLIQTVFWVTVFFIGIERLGLSKVEQTLSLIGSKWTPDDLKETKFSPKKKVIPKVEVIFSLIWIVIWPIAYFNADHLLGIYQSGDGQELQFVMPIFNQEILLSYWPIVLIFIGLQVALAIYKLIVGRWTMKLATVNAIILILSSITIIVIASNPNLFNDAFIPYLAELLDTTTSSLASNEKWQLKVFIAVVIITTIMGLFESYRKARIK